MMYIHAMGSYIPEGRVDNSYFYNVNGLTDEWIVSRTGIKTRSKALAGETTNTMGVLAVANTLRASALAPSDIDLIVGASYSPNDTVATLAHVVQREFAIAEAKALYLSSACSSFVNAMEVVEGYFAMGKAEKALVVVSEHNTAYANETCPKSGHLWGDGAAAIIVTKERIRKEDSEIVDIFTQGLGHIGKGGEGVYLDPKGAGIVMPDGRDVFIQACHYMPVALNTVVDRNGYTIDDVAYLVPHQANLRIVSNIANQYKIGEERFLNTIESLGNTGSASVLVTLVAHRAKLKKGELVGLTAFGGGYSCGAILIRW